MLTPKELEAEFPEILSSLKDYALIKNNSGLPYTIFDVTNQAFVLVEIHYDDLVSLMLQRGVKVANNLNEVKDPDHKFYIMQWDKEKKEWIKVLKEQ
jgi:hypothetical protein